MRRSEFYLKSLVRAFNKEIVKRDGKEDFSFDYTSTPTTVNKFGLSIAIKKFNDLL